MWFSRTVRPPYHPSTAKDLKATLNALAEIDAHVEHVILGTKNEPDLNELAWSVHNLLGIVRDLARDQARV